MQQFTVPQFIDVEDKIIGPVTTRQFVILLAAAILIAIFYKVFDFTAFVVFGLLTIGIAFVLAFVKVNGRPFHFFLLNIIQTFRRPNLRTWHHLLGQSADDNHVPPLKFDDTKSTKEYYERSRLAELSLIVDTQGAYQGAEQEEDFPEITKR